MKTVQTWVPIKFVKAGSHLLVHLINPEKLNFNYGFIRDSLNASLNQRLPEKILPLNTWLAETKNSQSELDSIGFIFHISRCGSTLLSQNLKATGMFVVLGEPSFFTSIYKYNGLFSPELQSVVAQKALLCWNQSAQYSGKQLLIKLNSNILTQREKINYDFSGSKSLFLFREPAPVIESLARKPPKYLKDESWRNEHPDLLTELESQVAPLALRASKKYLSGLNEICTAVSQGAQSCDYADLKMQFNEIIDYFSFAKVNQRFDWCDSWDSKNGEWEKVTYRPVEHQVLRDFNQINETVLKILIKKYHKLSNLIGSNNVNKD